MAAGPHPSTEGVGPDWWAWVALCRIRVLRRSCMMPPAAPAEARPAAVAAVRSCCGAGGSGPPLPWPSAPATNTGMSFAQHAARSIQRNDLALLGWLPSVHADTHCCCCCRQPFRPGAKKSSRRYCRCLPRTKSSKHANVMPHLTCSSPGGSCSGCRCGAGGRWLRRQGRQPAAALAVRACS